MYTLWIIFQYMTGQKLPQHEDHKYDLGNLCASNNVFYPEMHTDHLHCMYATTICTQGDCWS